MLLPVPKAKAPTMAVTFVEQSLVEEKSEPKLKPSADSLEDRR